MTQLSLHPVAAAILAPLAVLAAASQAQAHAHLVSANPGPNGLVTAAARSITLQFNEAVMPRFSGFDLFGGNGAKVLTSPVSVDPRSRKALIATLKAPLGAGTYKVNWHVVSADTHRMQGSYTFRVR